MSLASFGLAFYGKITHNTAKVPLWARGGVPRHESTRPHIGIGMKWDRNMVHSMTGYGRGEIQAPSGVCVVEVRSLNHRYCEIAVKTPRSVAAIENRLREAVRSRFSRGRFDVHVSVDFRAVSSRKLVVDHALARQLYLALTELGRELGLHQPVNLATLMEMREVMRVEENEHTVEGLWPAIEEALDSALANLEQMRIAEGESLGRDILQRIQLIEAWVEQIRSRLPALLADYRQKLEARISRHFGDIEIEPTRLAQEVVLFAERSDVSEEMTRLHTHLGEFKRLLQVQDPVGRKLDFLLQEMNREINTTSSKIADSDVAALVVDIKSELERIREQAQNIE
jgi:uncharacterized protein (TIGR00255 family)